MTAYLEPQPLDWSSMTTLWRSGKAVRIAPSRSWEVIMVCERRRRELGITSSGTGSSGLTHSSHGIIASPRTSFGPRSTIDTG